MKKIKLLLAAMAAMVGLSANAQTWTASEVGEGYYMLYNVGTSKFLTKGNGWGTQASITEANADGNGIAVQLENINGKYKIRTDINGENKGLEHLSGGTIYTDQCHDNKQSSWVFTQVGTDNGPVYTIVSADNHGGGEGAYLTAGVDGTIVTSGTDGTINGAKWKLMSLPAQPIGMSDASEVNPVDATSLIVNQNFSFPAVLKNDSWTMVSSNYNACGGDVTNPCAESWRATFTLSQVLTVPNGVYELTAQAAVTEYTATGEDLPVVYANDQTIPFTAMTNGEGSMSAVSTQFTAGNYTVGPIRVIVTAGSLTIGVRGTRTDTWCVWDNFKLTYKGVDLTALRDALQAKIDAVPALEGTTTTAAYTYAKDYADGIDVSSLATEEAISNATNELDNRVNAAKALQTNYARYNTVKAAALAIATSLDTTTPDAVFDAATTNDAVVAAIATLRAAFLAELPNVSIPVDPGYIDVTAVMVDNASVRQNTDYWTIEGTPNGGYSWGKCANNECEFYNQNFKFYQTLALTPGTWEFGVSGFHRGGQGDFNTYFYAGVDQILIPGVESSVVNTMVAAETYFNNGNGKVALKFLVEAAQNVEIGIDNQDTQTDKWTIFRDFTLKYYGAPDYTVYEDQWTALVADANTAKTTYANVTGTELTALNDAIDDSPAGSNLKATYIDKIDALQTALNTFNAAAPAYDKYVAYRAETVTLFGEAVAATVDAPTSAAEALVAVQNLNIAQYNKVASDYTFSATGLIGDFGSWTGTATVAGETATPNYLSSEHWSGTTHAYYEQASTGWDSSTGWTIQYQKICTLPAGSYVIKVAARTSGAGVTSLVSCSATTATTTLPAEDARARGINTSGVASWSDSDTFAGYEGYNVVTAPGQTGLGWQWRFLPFTLATETEVTMTFYAEASSQYQWMSIADGELLSTTKLADDVAYNEAATNTITNTIIADVTLTRTIKEGYNTVCLPFNLTANQVTNQFGAGTEVYAFSENSVDANNAVINFNKGDGSITANVPVLVKATTESTSQTFEGVQIVAAGDAKVAGTNFDFVGTYAPIATIAAGDYFIGNGKLYKSAGSTSMNAFRAYIHAKSAEVKPILFIDDEATSIDAINGLEAESGVIYNLAGQRISKMQKGINIVNGKKVLY